MGAIREKIEAWMSAVTFAEAGEQEMALQIVGRRARVARKKRSTLNDIMMAITFAEAGLPDVARQYMDIKQPRQRIRQIELPGVRVWYGLATVNP